ERLDRGGAALRGVAVRERRPAAVAARAARGDRRPGRPGPALRRSRHAAHGRAEGRAAPALPREPRSRGLRHVPAVSPGGRAGRTAPRPAVLAALALLCAPPVLAARVPAPRTLAQAESLAATPSNGARDRALDDWAKKASANDLAWLLRLPPIELGGAEAGLLDRSEEHTSELQSLTHLVCRLLPATK